MLNLDYIRNAFETSPSNPKSVSLNIRDNKQGLRDKYAKGEPVIVIDYACSEVSEQDRDLFYDLFSCFMGIATYKVKGENHYGCFHPRRINWETLVYGLDGRKLTRVVSDMLSHCETIGDIAYPYATYANWTSASNVQILLRDAMVAIGRLPREYESNPVDMPIHKFLPWIGEQLARVKREVRTTYYLDFRPEACLLAGNGRGFRSCFGLPFFPHQESSCYNNSPGAYATNSKTAILYSLAEDGRSLTNRSWVYFPDGESVHFGRFYGNEINRDVTDKVAQALGFDTHRTTCIGNVSDIATGDGYLSDSLEVGYGPCRDIYYDNRIRFGYTCISCGDNIDGDEGNSLCDECRVEKYTCEHCGNYMDEDNIYNINGSICCNSCVRYCEHCNEYELRDNMTDIGQSSRYVWICQHCIDNHYTVCDDCGAWIRNDEIYYIESSDRHVCSDCIDDNYSTCPHCDEYFSNDNMVECATCNESLCRGCASACSDCSDTVCPSCIELYNGDVYCSDCLEKIEQEQEQEFTLP